MSGAYASVFGRGILHPELSYLGSFQVYPGLLGQV